MVRRVSLLLVVLLLASLGLAGCFLTGGLVAEFVAAPWFGYPPLDVRFDAGASRASDAGIVAYAWDFDDDGVTDATGSTAEYTFLDKGVYPVTLTITDSGSNTASITRNVQALSLPPTARFDHWPYLVAKNQPVEFDASESADPDGEIVEYIWDFGDGTLGAGMFVEHIYTSAGGQGKAYKVTLTVVDDDGVSDSISRDVQVIGCDTCG